MNAVNTTVVVEHEYSGTPLVANITRSRVPADRVKVNGMVVYRVDGLTDCEDSSDGGCR